VAPVTVWRILRLMWLGGACLGLVPWRVSCAGQKPPEAGPKATKRE
jgi:hypothetical protein